MIGRIPFPHSPAAPPSPIAPMPLLLRTPVAAATVRDETALEVIGAGTTVAEQTARRLDDSTHRAPMLLGDAVECFESVVCE